MLVFSPKKLILLKSNALKYTIIDKSRYALPLRSQNRRFFDFRNFLNLRWTVNQCSNVKTISIYNAKSGKMMNSRIYQKWKQNYLGHECCKYFFLVVVTTTTVDRPHYIYLRKQINCCGKGKGVAYTVIFFVAHCTFVMFSLKLLLLFFSTQGTKNSRE